MDKSLLTDQIDTFICQIHNLLSKTISPVFDTILCYLALL
nr:MAG TPA: hypothetical protein [Bacteriophage sp.]